jgi:hypothetical protein
MEKAISKKFNSVTEIKIILNWISFAHWLENCAQECACIWAVEGFRAEEQRVTAHCLGG